MCFYLSLFTGKNNDQTAEQKQDDGAKKSCKIGTDQAVRHCLFDR